MNKDKIIFKINHKLRKTVACFKEGRDKISQSLFVRNEHCIMVPLKYEIHQNIPAPSIAVICHMFYPELMDEFAGYLSNIPFPFDLYLTTDTEAKKAQLKKNFIAWNKGKVDIRIAPNRGRDIAPKLITCADVYNNYEYILHIHSKKSLHSPTHGKWCYYLLNTLLGSQEIVKSIFEAFQSDENLGMMAPQHYKVIRPWLGWSINFAMAKSLIHRMGKDIFENRPVDFPSGSMFWARTAALRPVLECGLTFNDFAPEDNQTDGTLAHAIERSYFFICEIAGFRWMKIISSQFYLEPLRWKNIKNRNDLKLFIKKNQCNLLGKNYE